MATLTEKTPTAASDLDIQIEKPGTGIDPSVEEQAESSVEEDSSTEDRAREKLEKDVLDLARNLILGQALQTHINSFGRQLDPTRGLHMASAAATAVNSTKELEKGLKAIFRASCFKRLETFHGMTMRLAQESSVTDVLDFFCTEAEYQMSEADAENKAIIEEVFGAKMKCMST